MDMYQVLTELIGRRYVCLECWGARGCCYKGLNIEKAETEAAFAGEGGDGGCCERVDNATGDLM